MTLSQTFTARCISPSADYPAGAQSAADLELCLAPAGTDFNGATSDYLNRPLRSRSQACREYQHRRAA